MTLITDTAPRRIQLKRTKGWRKTPGSIVVARPSRWGNPFRVGSPYRVTEHDGTLRRGDVETPEQAVALFRDWVASRTDADLAAENIRRELAGHDLCCWCRLDRPCHADVLLEIANPTDKEKARRA